VSRPIVCLWLRTPSQPLASLRRSIRFSSAANSALDTATSAFFVQRMRTRWGTRNHARPTIRLNTELAKKPLDCVEYVVVHEMAHILEPSHNPRFIALMDQFIPTDSTAGSS